ncbi:MAG: hypothetical protein PHE93_00040 [Clostridia bacterium]|nr:hypothetical protein [Clostridia bacterium]
MDMQNIKTMSFAEIIQSAVNIAIERNFNRVTINLLKLEDEDSLIGSIFLLTDPKMSEEELVKILLIK